MCVRVRVKKKENDKTRRKKPTDTEKWRNTWEKARECLCVHIKFDSQEAENQRLEGKSAGSCFWYVWSVDWILVMLCFFLHNLSK